MAYSSLSHYSISRCHTVPNTKTADFNQAFVDAMGEATKSLWGNFSISSQKKNNCATRRLGASDENVDKSSRKDWQRIKEKK
jgi:hypothetical protein